MTKRLLFVSSAVAALTLFAGVALAESPFGIDRPLPVLDVGRNCGTPEPADFERAQVREAVTSFLRRTPLAAVGGQIRVAFHVVYNGSEGNIPQSQIDAQIAELNKAYSGFYGGVNTG